MAANASAIRIVTKRLREHAINSEIAASREKPPFDEIYREAALHATVTANLLDELVKERDAAKARISSLEAALKTVLPTNGFDGPATDAAIEAAYDALCGRDSNL